MSTATTITSLAYVQENLSGKPKLVKKKVEIPAPAPHQAVVKVGYVAQNPTDVQSFDRNTFGPGVVLGCDFVGEVIQKGDRVENTKKGEIRAGLIWGGETKSLGGYSQYTIVDNAISFPVPQSIKPEAAATVPLAATTAWLALLSNRCLGIPRSQETGRKVSVLIWGGSSSVGQFAIQVAHHFGFHVITTASPHNHLHVRELGADEVFDYKLHNVVGHIKKAAPILEYVFDTIGSETSSVLASQTITQHSAEARRGKLCTVRPDRAHTEKCAEGVEVRDVLVWTAFLRNNKYGELEWPASQEDHELAVELFQNLPSWLERGIIKSNHVKLLPIDSIEEGFEMYRNGQYSAAKIVYKMCE